MPKRSEVSVLTNEACLTASEALFELAKIGSQDNGLARRHASMLRYAREGTSRFQEEFDILRAGHFKRGTNGLVESVERIDGNGIKSRVPVIIDPVAYTAACQQLLRAPSSYTGVMPDPYSWKDLEKFSWPPSGIDSDLIARLGPFYREG